MTLYRVSLDIGERIGARDIGHSELEAHVSRYRNNPVIEGIPVSDWVSHRANRSLQMRFKRAFGLAKFPLEFLIG